MRFYKRGHEAQPAQTGVSGSGEAVHPSECLPWHEKFPGTGRYNRGFLLLAPDLHDTGMGEQGLWMT